MILKNILAVAVGGAMGSLVRYALVLHFTSTLPLTLGVLLANVIGSFLFGFSVYFLQALNAPSSYFLAIQTGFLGGLTTFSSFIFDLHTLIAAKHYAWLFFYLVLSLGLGLIFFYMGFFFANFLAK